MADKVLFGFSDLYVGTYSVSTGGTVTLGTPYHQAGAVGWSPEEDSEEYNFYADNIAYYTEFTGGKISGDLVVARYDDQFKKNFLGYGTTTGGGIAKVKGASKPKIYMMFEVQTDTDPIRAIYYNGSLGNITREFSTIEESREVATESLQVSFVGDENTGIQYAIYHKSDSAYSTMFSTPPTPALTT